MNLSLFDSPPSFDKEGLARKLRALADQRVFIGTSSWKYDGWMGQIYSRERYLSRGKFSQKTFEAECLAEFAETFPIVCGDFSFYQFPTPEFWRKLFTNAPDRLQFALKVPEEVTVEVFPRHPRYGPRAGRTNEAYLNADAFRAQFLEPLEPYRSRIACLIFEFGARGATAKEFVAQIVPFFDLLPSTFRYAVEVRNREFLVPLYFDTLKEHRAAHVFNAWTKMPPLQEQVAIPEAFTADFTVVRRRCCAPLAGCMKNAVAQFAPYTKIQDENPEGRKALRDLIQRMKQERRTSYIFANNRFEGNAPETIRAITDEKLPVETLRAYMRCRQDLSMLDEERIRRNKSACTGRAKHFRRSAHGSFNIRCPRHSDMLVSVRAGVRSAVHEGHFRDSPIWPCVGGGKRRSGRPVGGQYSERPEQRRFGTQKRRRPTYRLGCAAERET